ncbi:Dyp-type peroxidase [Streptomyces pristinaespiralis]|uniref:Peroxidase n=2 Tax=Streptomyces pristinaespiralis TaxID=38300 RepID=A0A0M4DTR7_STRPR|nr:Dyp-type peroxidase [Streptomyces pristinaespiralis]ALC22512.1 peroxidase [Streptomyces pristinaespiralis]QMU14893.1 Dyp-type peroxidase [Streptomyces pristinaespiralis]
MTDLALRESTEIQGDVLAGFKKDHVQLLFLKFDDATRARTWLRRLKPRIATTRQVAAFNAAFSAARRNTGGDDPKALNAVWRSVSFTHGGIRTLTGKDPFPKTTEGTTEHAFKQGSAMRAGMLGDTGDNSPENWLFGDSNAQPVHAVLTIAADKVEDLRAAIAQERQEASVHKVVIVFEQDGATLTGDRRGKEHFGFKDGVSEPAVQGFDEPDPKRPEWKKGSPGTRIIPAGEFVIGEQTVSGTPSGLPEWTRNGSFHVVRRLGQDVPSWWAQIGARLKELKNAKAVPPEATAEWLAARLVGRWRSGTPVAKCPHADVSFDPDCGNDNDISFADDLEGETTPLFSHLRKTNPRDGLALKKGDKPVPEKGGLDGRRIMRRGIPFGLPFDPAGSAGHGPDAARGLVFVSYQADLVRQFEFIQKDWVIDTKFPDRDPRVGADPMIGVTTDVSFKGQQVRFEQFVRTEGAVYAFTPSLSTLDRLADGKLSDDAPKIKVRVTEEGNHEISAVSTFDIGDIVDAGRAKLLLQDDGKLVVFDENDDPRWASNNPATPGARAVFQEDGNFVIYTPDNQPVWASATDGNPGAVLSVQADGNVVIYNSKGAPVWHTKSRH